MTALLFCFLSTISFVSPSSFSDEENANFWKSLAMDRLRSIDQQLLQIPPKNVIVFLGDGMGLTAVSTARMYKSEKLKRPYSEMPFSFENFHSSALVKTSSLTKHVTDSAASAVALFSGHKVEQYTLGLQPNNPIDCSSGDSANIDDGIAELALKKNLSVGFVTTHRITSATPAALFAKGVDRFVESDSDAENLNRPLCKGKDIGQQILRFPASEFKVIMGGGRNRLQSQRNDGRNIMKEWQNLPGERILLNSPQDLDNLEINKNSKVFGAFAENSFPFYLDDSEKKSVPRLKEMTEKAVRIMEKGNENGYFLMIEGGIIDTAEHSNQMRLASEEVLEFDEAIRKAREMTNPSETLIIVTADHSHAMALPGSIDKKDSVFGSKRVWGQREEDPMKVPGIYFVSGPGADRPLDIEPHESSDPHFVSPAAIYAIYGSHGAEDVGLWADGPFARIFSGTIDNTAVGVYIKSLLCLYDNKTLCTTTKMINTSSNDHMGQEVLFPALVVAVVAVLVALLSTSALLLLLWRNKPKHVVNPRF